MLKRFLSYYKPHRGMFVLDMLAALLISVTGMVYPIVTNKMLKEYIPSKEYRAVIIAGCIVLGIYVLRLFLQYFVQYYGHVIGVRMQSQMRQDLFSHLQKLPFRFYDNNETGRIMTRLTSDLFEVCELAHHGPENLIISTLMIVLSFAYLMTLDWLLTLIVFICVPILVLVTLRYRAPMKKGFDDRRKSNATINAAVESSVTGIRVTKAYTNAQMEKEKFKKAMSNDLNTSLGITALYDVLKAKCNDATKLAAIADFDKVLSLDLIKKAEVKREELKKQAVQAGQFTIVSESGEENAEVEAKIQARQDAKKAKNFAEADRIRDELKAEGIEVTDIPHGAKWKRI